MDRDRLIELLQEMDATQRETDEEGGAEVAWYYYRDKIEDAMGLDRGWLDTAPRPESVTDVLQHWAPESGTS